MEMLQSLWAAFQMLATHMDTSVTSFFLFFKPANSKLDISNGKMVDVYYLNKRQGSYKGSATESACDGIRIWKKLKIRLIPLHEVRAASFLQCFLFADWLGALGLT